MEGYHLTTKGFILITLLFFVFFISVTAILTLARQPDGDQPNIGLPSPPVGQTGTPAPSDPGEVGASPAENTPPATAPVSTDNAATTDGPTDGPTTTDNPPTGNLPTTDGPTTTVNPPTDNPTATVSPPTGNPPTGNPPTGSPPGPLPTGGAGGLSPPQDGIALLFPMSSGHLTEQSKSDLRRFMETIAGKNKNGWVLVVEGYAYSGEAESAGAVEALAEERMRVVYDDCVPLGNDVYILPRSSTSEMTVSAQNVVGVLLYILDQTEK
ncbi:MAG: hypothetical protein FWE59_02155 [Oscillospiraceae bacterium]|nr:hypothetical protein [Oscillospiraceae bacterium]